MFIAQVNLFPQRRGKSFGGVLAIAKLLFRQNVSGLPFLGANWQNFYFFRSPTETKGVFFLEVNKTSVEKVGFFVRKVGIRDPPFTNCGQHKFIGDNWVV